MTDKKDEIYNGSIPAENAENAEKAGAHGEISPEPSASFFSSSGGGGNAPAGRLGLSGGEPGEADETAGADTLKGGDAADSGMLEISEDDLELSIARIRDEVLSMSGLAGDDAESPSGDDSAEKPAKENKPAKKPAAKKPVNKPAAEKTENKFATKKTGNKSAVKKPANKPTVFPSDDNAGKPAKENKTAKKPAVKKPTKKTGNKPTKENSIAKKPAVTRPAGAGVIVFEDFDEDEDFDRPVTLSERVPNVSGRDGATELPSYDESGDTSSLADNGATELPSYGESGDPSGLAEGDAIELLSFVESDDPSSFSEDDEIILFGGDSGQPRQVILFEDEDEEDGEKPVVLFEDVDDTYLNQVGLVDRRLEMLRSRSGVSAEGSELPEAAPATGVIRFVDEDEVPAGKDALDYDVDTLIKQLVRQSKRRHEKVIPVEELRSDPVESSYLDYKGGQPDKAAPASGIDGLLRAAGSDPVLYNLYNAVTGGVNTLSHSIKSEAVTLDSEWITTIEDGLYFIEDIVKNPRKFIIDEEIIMEVERARKTSAKTVRHLAQNTKNISKIDDDGFVTPKKVLTVEMEEDLAIYENRFICTLINRLTAFVESRKSDIQANFRMYEIAHMAMNSKFKYGPGEVECSFTVAVKEPPKDQVLIDKAMYLVGKVEEISKRLRILRNSGFVKKLSGLKPIVPPIAKTNIIKMNVNYSTCYKLWLFISAYTMVGYNVDVREKKLPVNGNYYDDLAAITAIGLQSLINHEIVNRDVYTHIEMKPARSRKYKLVPEHSFVHAPKDRSVTLGDDAVNEYFFRKIQETFEEKAAEIEPAAKNTVAEKRVININYERYCKALLNVSNELIADSIESAASKPERLTADALKRKKQELDKHKETLKKYSAVARLKAADLEKTLCEEARLEVKLDKLKREFEVLDAREKKRRIKPKKEKAVSAEPDRKEKAVKKAAEYKRELIEKIDAESDEAERKKQEKRRQRQRERELKLLEQLKDKYEK